ncbi:MAG TPA: DUF4432 family protein [Lichenihabitans sp.]|nr:DUF4432 family protein [Lichenihabitans sp.]
MADPKPAVTVALERGFFAETERTILTHGELEASLFRYATGVEAIRIANARGSVIVLPYMGQMIWRATFEGVELAMQSMFEMPRPATTIVETYGPLAYHAGILRNGVPTPEDTHPLHGEMPCMRMDAAGLACGTDGDGAFLTVTGLRDYAMGFGAHYEATPSVTLRAGATSIAVTMEARNLSAAPMDLMYLCHANFAFSEHARFVQPVPFDTDHVVTRTAIPGHVRPTDDYRLLLDQLAKDPARMERLSEPLRYDPEQVCYVKGLTPGADGLVRFMLERPEGDGFTVAYDPKAMPHLVRWVLHNSDQRTAAFAMPATCEPEGYTAEKRKGHVRSLAGGARVAFTTHLGYVDRKGAADLARQIEQRAGEG